MPNGRCNQICVRLFEEGASSAGKDAASMPILAEHMVMVGDESAAQAGAELWCFMREMVRAFSGQRVR